MKSNSLLLLIFLFSFCIHSSGQSLVQGPGQSPTGHGPTREDYKRAVAYQWGNLVNKKVFNTNIQPTWFDDSTGFGFITQDKTQKLFKKFLWKTNKIEPWFDQERLAKILSDSAKTTIKATDLPLQALNYIDKSHLSFSARGKTIELDLNTYKIKTVNPVEWNEFESTSPDSQWVAYTDQYNLFIRSTKDGSVKKLSKNGERYYEYGTFYGWSDIIEGENGERPKRFRVHWSPDSKWIQTNITDLRGAKKMYLLDWSVDTLYKPKLLAYYRGSPGDTDMVKMIPVFYNVTTGEEYIKSNLQATHTNPIQFEWSKESGIIYQENAIRGYQAVEMHRVNLNTKTDDLLYRETSPTNIDNFQSWIDEEWGKVLFTSEKSGWKQLYTLDLKTKALEPLTTGDYYINQVFYWDPKKKYILFTASGKEPGRNPYHQHLYRYNMVDKAVTLLTPEDLNHDVSISPDGNFFTDNMSALNQATRTVVRNIKPTVAPVEIAKADISTMDSLSFKFPEPYTSMARDGQTTLYGAIWKPTNFNPSKKYPVIDQTYTGPHTFMYPRNFVTAMSRSNQALAELGFIVITVDGLGTANRSKAFHNVSYKNMGKNLEDHRLAILQLGRKNSWMDTTRVGIFGHSAGGYDAGHAVLEYPDFYKVAVASSADHDFRMEKDWWPEMYMGWPVDSTYNQVSNITMAGRLKGKLLITHGGIDENVNPSATFKLAEALIRANKEFDMLILPSQRHGYQGAYNEYFTKKKWNYFVEHLLKAEPIWDIEMK